MIISYDPEGFYNCETYKEIPVLHTTGCGCCSARLPCTRENLDKAILEAQEWLETLRDIEPVDPACYKEEE